MRYNKNIGDAGEAFAAEILINSGYVILERNYRTKAGEIDIIAMKDGILHFVEVKTRTSSKYGFPAEAVTKEKRIKMRKAADMYIQSRRPYWQGISFDVCEIMTELIENCI